MTDAQRLVAVLGAMGFGPRSTARILNMSSGTVMHYRHQSGIKTPKPSPEEIIATMPITLAKECLAYRAMAARRRDQRTRQP